MPKNIKNIQKQLDNLYKNYDPTDQKHNDKTLLRNELIGHAAKKRWSDKLWKEKNLKVFNTAEFKKKISEAHKDIAKNRSKEQKKEIADKIFNSNVDSGRYLTRETWAEIHGQLWGPDRNDRQLHKKLCKKYGITESTLRTCLAGGSMIPDPADHKKKLLDWEKKYGRRSHKFIAISPTGKKHVFETQAELGNFAINKWNFLDMPSTRGGSLCKKSRVRTKGILKGWQFLKK